MESKKNKNILPIIMGVLALIAIIAVVIVHLKINDISNEQPQDNKELNEARTFYETGEYKNALDSYLLIINEENSGMEENDYIQLTDSLTKLEDVNEKLNYAYSILDATDNTNVLFEVYFMVADYYVSQKNYKAAYEMLSDAETKAAGILDKYCDERTDVTICLAPYDDTDDDSYVFFGSYPQTGYSQDEIPEYVVKASFDENGYAKIYGSEYVRIRDNGEYVYYMYEPVRWWILEEEDGELTLFSDKILDARSYADTLRDATWDTSDLRTWLNGEFYNTCFCDAQKEHLLLHTTEPALNYFFEFTAGVETEDYLGLMSSVLLANGRYCFKEHNSDEDNIRRKTTGTEYAIARGLFVNDEGYGEYWTNTSANVAHNSTVVITEDGFILMESGGETVNKSDVGVRPFITVMR